MWGSGSDTKAANRPGYACGELGVAVVDEPRRRDGIGLPLGIGRARGRREHLHLHPGLVHLLQARRDARRDRRAAWAAP